MSNLTNLDSIRILYNKIGKETPVAPMFKNKEEVEKALTTLIPGTCSMDHALFIQALLPYYGISGKEEEFGISKQEYKDIMTSVNGYLVEFGKLCPSDCKDSDIGNVLAQFNENPIGAYNFFNERGGHYSTIADKLDDAIACISGSETVESTPEAFAEAGIDAEALRQIINLEATEDSAQ